MKLDLKKAAARYRQSVERRKALQNERDATILERATRGDSFAEIGHDLGLSREGVRQIVRRLTAESSAE